MAYVSILLVHKEWRSKEEGQVEARSSGRRPWGRIDALCLTI